jgi:hypothetical protein
MSDPIQNLPTVPFTTRQAFSLGVDTTKLSKATRERRIVRLLRGVYLRSEVPLSPLVRAQAAALVISPHSVVCDRSAAWIWGVGAFDYGELDAAPPLESYVLRGHNPTDRPHVRGGTRDLSATDWVQLGPVRVTTPVRTAMDLGCKLNRRTAIAAMDALMRAEGFSTADMSRVLPRYFRRRGCIQLRQLVPLVDARSESAGESWARLEIEDAGLPAPIPNFWVTWEGIDRYRLDLAYPHARIAIEYDGEEFHSDHVAVARDRKRREWLEEHGWIVIVLDKHSFTDEAIAEWLGRLQQHLAEAARPARSLRRPPRFV